MSFIEPSSLAEAISDESRNTLAGVGLIVFALILGVYELGDMLRGEEYQDIYGVFEEL